MYPFHARVRREQGKSTLVLSTRLAPSFDWRRECICFILDRDDVIYRCRISEFIVLIVPFTRWAKCERAESPGPVVLAKLGVVPGEPLDDLVDSEALMATVEFTDHERDHLVAGLEQAIEVAIAET